MPSALWPVRSQLVDLFTTTFAGQVVADEKLAVVVFDGPRPRSNRPRRFLQVGAIGDLEDGPWGRTAQQPSSMGNGWRDEVGEVDCVAVAWHGDSEDLATLDAAVQSMVASCETAINADRNLGGLLQPNNNIAEITALEVREAHTDRGPFVELVFTISYATVLTS